MVIDLSDVYSPLLLQIASLYADLRAQSTLSGGVPIAVRHIESIMRMAEATARMSLRDYVRDDDVDFAIKVERECYRASRPTVSYYFYSNSVCLLSYLRSCWSRFYKPKKSL